jgi:chitinase
MIAGKRSCGRFPLKAVYPLLGLCLAFSFGCAKPQSPAAAAVPTFTRSFVVSGRQYRYVVAGRSPEQGGTTTIPTVLVPVSLVFQGYRDAAGHPLAISASSAVTQVVDSPIFREFAFATGDTQYGDAVQRAEFYKDAVAKDWHTLLGPPRVTPVLSIEIPLADGYVLTSKQTGHSLAIVDRDFVQKQLFNQLSKMKIDPHALVIALTKDADFYALHDATVCCSWGSHGVFRNASLKAPQAYVLGSYLEPGVVPRFSDIQPLTEQIAEWMNDPLRGLRASRFPAWQDPSLAHGACGGRGEGSFYRFGEPTDGGTMPNATVVKLHGTAYHLENVALLPWFAENAHPETFQNAYSFPDTRALKQSALPCSLLGRASAPPKAVPLPDRHAPNGHMLIGYWVGNPRVKTFPLRDVSPQWDVVIVSFAPPVKGSTSRLRFRTPAGYTQAQFRSDIRYLQHRGKKVLVSLGGGGQVVTLSSAKDVRDFVSSVSAIVKTYGFNGVDLDFETPSLILQPGDTNFRKPTTPSVANLIAAMWQLHRRFGPKFMISVVPEGPQVMAGMQTYGGQFGSFLPVIYGTRKILSFVDVQNYNTPPLEGLDGNYYMPRTADYYVAMSELLLHGFPVDRNPKSFFPPLPPQKVVIGFLVGRSPSSAIGNSMRSLIEGRPYAGMKYELRRRAGYPDFGGVMFWNIQADRRDNYRLSNLLGPFLHGLPPIGR